MHFIPFKCEAHVNDIKNSVTTSNKTHHISVTNIRQLMIFKGNNSLKWTSWFIPFYQLIQLNAIPSDSRYYVDFKCYSLPNMFRPSQAVFRVFIYTFVSYVTHKITNITYYF